MRGHATGAAFRRDVTFIATFLLLAAASGCSRPTDAAAPPATKPGAIKAQVFQVQHHDWPRLVATQGNLIADETTVVGTKVAGRIDQVTFDLGDIVKAGAPLASLDRIEHEERVRQAEAELNQARAAIGLANDGDLDSLDPKASPVVLEQQALWDQARADRERIRLLQNRQAATESQMEVAVANEEVAAARYAAAINTVRENMALVRVRSAQLELARQQLSDATIKAPFDGRIQERHVSPGMFVQLGEPIATLIRSDPLRYRGTIPEPYAGDIAIGQEVRLTDITISEATPITITRISPSLDPFSRSLLFEAEVPNPDHAIQAGRFAQGTVVLDQSNQVVVVPKSAIVQFAGTQKVWKVVDGKAVEQPVETGSERANAVAILSGLRAGDEILVDGTEGRAAKVDVQDVITEIAGDPPSSPKIRAARG